MSEVGAAVLGSWFNYYAQVPVYGWADAYGYFYPSDPESFHWTTVEDAASDTPYTETTTHGGVSFDLTPTVVDAIVPGSVRFTWGGHTYIDRAGSIYRDVSQTTNAGTLAGTIDYGSGIVTLTNYVAGANTISVSGLATVFGSFTVTEIFFRTPGCPLKDQSFGVRASKADGTGQVSAVSDGNGDFSASGVEGHVDTATGVVKIAFGEWLADASLTADQKAEPWYNADNLSDTGEIWHPIPVLPNTILFNSVVYSFVPLDSDILGIDPVRLPQDGRVPIFRSGDAVLVHQTQTTVVASPVAGATETLRMRISFAQVHDALGAAVPSNQYTVDLDGGTLTWANPLSLGSFTGPFTISHRIEDLLLCSDVQITGELAFVASLTHDFPAATSYASSVVLIGDMQARVEKFHDLATFTAWADVATGANAPANYNTVLYPVLVTNRGAVEERWRITFTSGTAFNVIGETYGQIVTGATINDNLAPTNPQTGVPYFFLDKRGWGGGWATGNTVRFNTRAANYPLWFVRTTLQGPVEAPNDHFRIQVRADAN